MSTMNMFILLLSFFIFQPLLSTSQPRHIVYLLHDDIGWSDIYATNGQFPTPFIDQLRSESVILDRHYIHYVCSVSRTQFLTGRRATNHGYGKIETFKYTQISGIPIGQPTIANWLRDFVSKNGATNPDIPRYKTYGVGKWHVGYSSESQTPQSKGFDHYYGFYQSGIDYKTKTHYHSKDIWSTNGEMQWDFFEDEQRVESAISTNTNTMDLYDYKIGEYLDDFIKSDPSLSLYLYVGVQTLHGPLSRVPRYSSNCEAILGTDASNQRLRICEYTYLTNDWLEDLVNNLKSHNLWDDTLLVFTADNGADIDVAHCNYPLRGSKFSYFDGNIRQLTFVAGGRNVLPESSFGTRQTLVSNMDWTPTLLSYAGVLDYIDSNDYAWDGKDQWNIISNGDVSNADDSLVISINSPDISSINSIKSYSILFKYTNRKYGDGHTYKYVKTDPTLDSDSKWLTKITDGWCMVNFTEGRGISVTEIDNSQWSTSAAIKNEQFLFDLTEDEGEKYNLMRLNRISGDRFTKKDRNRLIKFAKNLITAEISLESSIDYYHDPIECLYDFYGAGNPQNFPVEINGVQGLYVQPFFSKQEYIDNITVCLDSLDGTAHAIPTKLRDLYLNEWVAPTALVNSNGIHEYNVVNNEFRVNKVGLLENGYVKLFAILCVICSLISLCYFLRFRGKKELGKGEYEPLLMNYKI